MMVVPSFPLVISFLFSVSWRNKQSVGRPLIQDLKVCLLCLLSCLFRNRPFCDTWVSYSASDSQLFNRSWALKYLCDFLCNTQKSIITLSYHTAVPMGKTWGKKPRYYSTGNHQSIKRLEKEIQWKVKQIGDFKSRMQGSQNFSCPLFFNSKARM